VKEIARRRCFNHPSRSAAARCSLCGETFCRECIVEHGERMTCASCLERPASASSGRFGKLTPLVGAVRLASGFMVLWLLFYLLGRAWLSIPDAFHRGELWK